MVLNKFIRDRQAPETLQAARQQQSNAYSEAPETPADSRLAWIFMNDAKKALMTLEAMLANQYPGDSDVHIYVITVHAMKSALANIGETELAAFAYCLERAGRNRDTAVMATDTPVFLDELRAVIGKMALISEKGSKDGEMASGELEYLREKLSVMRTACAAYDKKTAKKALASLREKTWPPKIMEQLDAIAMHLLHSEFDEAASLMEEMNGTLG